MPANHPGSAQPDPGAPRVVVLAGATCPARPLEAAQLVRALSSWRRLIRTICRDGRPIYYRTVGPAGGASPLEVNERGFSTVTSTPASAISAPSGVSLTPG